MPKMKTKSGAKKRFSVRAGGSIKRGQAFKRHILTKKTTKNKRQLRGSTGVHETNTASVRAMRTNPGSLRASTAALTRSTISCALTSALPGR